MIPACLSRLTNVADSHRITSSSALFSAHHHWAFTIIEAGRMRSRLRRYLLNSDIRCDFINRVCRTLTNGLTFHACATCFRFNDGPRLSEASPIPTSTVFGCRSTLGLGGRWLSLGFPREGTRLQGITQGLS